MRNAALAYARQLLGPCQVVKDHSWEHRWSCVLRLRDSAGDEWFLKQHSDYERYVAEVMAYQRWVPALDDDAPTLRAHDDASRALILSRLPGRLAPWPAPRAVPATSAAETAVQRQAGVLLRRLHDAQPAVPAPDFAATKLNELEALAHEHADLFAPNELAFARAAIRRSADVPTPLLVPCHRDYSMRNWVIDRGRVRVLDFEWARLDVWISDLSRLELGVWQTRPDLREAFLEGYGRELDDFDQVLLRGCSAFTAVWLVIKARESAQPSFEQSIRDALHYLIAQ